MKRPYFAFALLALLALAWGAPRATAAPAAAPDLNTVVSNLQAAGGRLAGLSANVSHWKFNEQLGIKEPTQSGTILFNKAPRRLRINYTQPQAKTVSVIGDEAVLIEPNLNQAFVSNTSRVAARTSTTNLLTVLTSASQLQKNFNAELNGEEAVNGQAATKITLRPKTASNYSRIEIWVDHKLWLPIKQVVYGRGERTTIILSNINLSKTIPESSFKVDYSKYKVVRG
jgi:outer membrane lipoprotein-sorting protein